jgi:hypothetical protein
MNDFFTINFTNLTTYLPTTPTSTCQQLRLVNRLANNSDF